MNVYIIISETLYGTMEVDNAYANKEDAEHRLRDLQKTDPWAHHEILTRVLRGKPPQ